MLRANGVEFPFREDSASTTTLVPMSFCRKADIKFHEYPYPSSAQLAVTGQECSLVGSADVDLHLQTVAGEVIIRKVPCEITSAEMEEILLGNDLLNALGVDVANLIISKAGQSFDMGTDEPQTAAPLLDFGENDEAAVRKALEGLVDDALENGLPEEEESRWRKLLQDFADVWRLKMGNDPRARKTPLIHR